MAVVYRGINSKMNQEAQCVDKSPKYQVVTSQQVKGYLRPMTEEAKLQLLHIDTYAVQLR